MKKIIIKKIIIDDKEFKVNSYKITFKGELSEDNLLSLEIGEKLNEIISNYLKENESGGITWNIQENNNQYSVGILVDKFEKNKSEQLLGWVDFEVII